MNSFMTSLMSPSKTVMERDDDDDPRIVIGRLKEENGMLKTKLAQFDEMKADLASAKQQYSALKADFEAYGSSMKKFLDLEFDDLKAKVGELKKEMEEVRKDELAMKDTTQLLQVRVDTMNELWNKEANVEDDVTELKVDMRDVKIDVQLLHTKVGGLRENTEAMVSDVQSYKNAILGGVDPNKLPPCPAPAANIRANHAPAANIHANHAQQSTCIIRASKGLVKGRNATGRGEAFTKDVISKLPLREGHFTLPEVKGMVPLKGFEDAPFEMWLAFMSSPSDVSKLFAYKGQLKVQFPDVYVQANLSKEVRMQRKLMFLGAKQYIANQASPQSWRLKWVDTLKGIIYGPQQARRVVIMDGEVARVVFEGNVRVVKETQQEVP